MSQCASRLPGLILAAPRRGTARTAALADEIQPGGPNLATPHLTQSGLLSLQRLTGNRAVQRLIQARPGALIQRLTDPLGDMSTFQSPGSSGWRGAIFGCYRNHCTRKHRGWDIHAASGTDCQAVVAGKITHATEAGGLGKYVVLKDSADATRKYYYAHLSAWEPSGTVAEGDKVGETGTSGNADAGRPHLHFQIKHGSSRVDPDGQGFARPNQVIEASGSSATAINFADPEPCTPCA